MTGLVLLSLVCATICNSPQETVLQRKAHIREQFKNGNFSAVKPQVASYMPREYVEPLAELYQTGPYYDIVIEGDLLYASTVYGFEILDISNPSEPSLIARESTIDNAEAIEVFGGFVYVADWTWGLHVFDARDPDEITEVWSYSNMEHLFDDVYIDEGRLYLCEANEGVLIYDLTLPHQPELIGTFADVRLPGAIFNHNGYSYITDWGDNMLYIADLRDPEDLRNIGRHNDGGRFLDDVWVESDMLYIARGPDGVGVYAVYRNTDLFRQSNIRIEGWTYAVTLIDTLLYVSSGGEGLLVYNVSDPTDPELLFQDNDNLRYAMKTVLSNDIAYVAGSWDGMLTYDVENRAEPQLDGAYSPSPSMSVPAVADGICFIPRYNEGLIVLDCEDPANPVEITTIDSIYCGGVVITGNWLYLTTYTPEDSAYYLKVWDVTDPSAPEAVSMTAIESAFPELMIDGDFLCATFYDVSVQLWNISDRENPELVSEVEDHPPYAAYLDNERLYISSITDVLALYDVSQPREPELLDEYTNAVYFYGICARDDIAILADGSNGWKVLDVSDPSRIRRIETIPPIDWAITASIGDSLLYLGDYDAGMQVYSFDDDPVYFGFLQTPGRAFEPVLDNGICYLNDYFDLTICRFDLTYGTPREMVAETTDFRLLPAWPNPFNSIVHISWEASQASAVSMTIRDVGGRKLLSRRFEPVSSGIYSTIWDAEHMTSGVYFVEMVPEFGQVRNLKSSVSQRLILAK